MSRTSECPEESVLLALAAEGAATPDVRSHVDACPRCQRTLERLKAEIHHLRSTVDPVGDPPATNGISQTIPD